MGRPKGSKNKPKTTANTRARSSSKAQEYDAPLMGDEAAIIITFAVSLFLFLSNLGLCGPIGAALKAVQLGLFGVVGYIFPIVLSFVVAFILSNIDNPHATLRMTSALFMLVFLSALLQLFTAGGVQDMSLMDFYSEGAELGIGGGIVGGALAMVLHTIAGTVGAVLILIVASFVCLIYTTGKPLARIIAKHSARAASHARDRAREDFSQVAESARLHREERRLAREEELRARRAGVDMQAIDLSAHQSLSEMSAGATASAEVNVADQTTARQTAVPEDPFTIPALDDTAAYEAALAAGADVKQPASTEPKLNAEPTITGMGAILGPDENAANSVELPLNVRHTPVTRDDRATMPDRVAIPAAAGAAAGAVTAAGSAETVIPIRTGASTATAASATTTTVAPSPAEKPAGMQVQSLDEDFPISGSLWDEQNLMDSYMDGGAAATARYAEETSDQYAKDTRILADAYAHTADDALLTGDEAAVDAELHPLEDSDDTASAAAYAGDDEVSVARNGVATIGRGDMEQGTRRIVASNGQVIDADVEPIKKKIESQLDREKKENTPTDADNAKVQQEILEKKKPQKPYVIPPLRLLQQPARQDFDTREEIRQNALTLQETLKSFGVNVTITNISIGPAVTRYELQPEIGVKVSKIVSLTNDIKMRLAAADIRIEAPIPGKSAVGIEVPNKHGATVYLGEVLGSSEFQGAKAKLAFGVGKDIAGKTIVTDIAKMPHLLIAGATGSGKSVCINTLIMSLLFKYKPEDVRMIMIDPKVVELSVYNGIPHLLIPVVTDPKKAASALNWAVAEMTDRYKKFAESGSRDLKGYNEKIMAVRNDPEIPEDQKPEKLPQIVIIIDELADLMMVSSQEVEDAICRIAQLARAAGMHLVIATQRPTVDVITGLIKANVPSRIAFAVSSGTDSRTIIDMNGAEKLLGKGDMLFFPQGIPKPVRVQGAFVSDQEVSDVVDFIKQEMGEVEYSERIQQQVQSGGGGEGGVGGGGNQDELFAEAGQLIIETEKASIGMLQRKFRIGFNRAARIMDQLADAGVVGPEEGTKPRKIIMTLAEFDELISNG
ncbi:MAG: DNA translocase FtsK 4TM domain-containing protein [Oribacterium sp.]|nr:DNA translocase FtsK 4TM domain-containing protein [Oribacterium sp.]